MRFTAALEQWPRDGVPANPRAWLVSAGRFKAIDGIRRRARFDALDDVGERSRSAVVDPAAWADDESVEDDRLRLIFTCCHPALAPDAQVALTLREVCGLTTEEIAQAFLTPAPDAGAAHRARQGQDPRRAHSVSGAGAGRAARTARRRAAGDLSGVQRGLRRVVGRVADAARSVGRGDPSGAAAGRAAARARSAGAAGADAAARIAARRAHLAESGELILLDDQDRSLWDRDQIAEGARLVETRAGVAAVRPVHDAGRDRGRACRGAHRRRHRLGRDRRSLRRRCARADAVAGHRAEPGGGGGDARRPGAGLALIDAILARGDLADYRLAHAARAELCRRLGRTAEARASYERALALTRQEPERRFLERRLAELPALSGSARSLSMQMVPERQSAGEDV